MLPADDTRPAPRSGIVARILEGLASVVLGIIVGVIGTFGHQLTASVLGVALPLGLVAGMVAVGLLVAGVRLALESRGYAALAALGAVGAIGLLALPGGSGTVLVPDNLSGTIWAIGPTLVAAVILAWPRLPARPRG
jgi:hypothetical protein